MSSYFLEVNHLDDSCWSFGMQLQAIQLDAQNGSTTPPKINIAPENDDLEDDLPLPGVYSQV